MSWRFEGSALTEIFVFDNFLRGLPRIHESNLIRIICAFAASTLPEYFIFEEQIFLQIEQFHVREPVKNTYPLENRLIQFSTLKLFF